MNQNPERIILSNTSKSRMGQISEQPKSRMYNTPNGLKCLEAKIQKN